MFTRKQYDDAVVEFFTNHGDLFLKYYAKNLVPIVVEAMGTARLLPSVISAEIAFNRLVADGTLERTDGKTEADDHAVAVAATIADFDRTVAEVEAPALTKDEIERFYSMGPREVAEHYWENDGYNSFRVRYDKAIATYGFVQPAQFWNGVKI